MRELDDEVQAILAAPGGGALEVDGTSLVEVAGQGRRFPISPNGVLRFVEDGEYASSFGLQWNEFPNVQLDTPELPESERRLRTETGLTPERVKGMAVLEAGCGMGRFLDVISEWDARLAVGIDLSSAVDACAANLADRDNAVVAQADIFALPFAPESFDVIFSIGVLNFTPDCEQAFKSLVPFLREGGEIAISVYAAVVAPGMGWAANLARRKAQRRLTRHLPKPFWFWWCKRVVPVFYRLERIPVLRYLRLAFPVLVYRDMPASWSVLDTFDTYASHYESRHRPKEVFAWFREMGLVDLDLLDSDDGWVSVTGRKPLT